MKNQVADRLRNMASRLEPMSRENEQEALDRARRWNERAAAISDRAIEFPLPTRYGVALGASVIAILLRLALDPVWGIRLPYITLFPAIMLWRCRELSTNLPRSSHLSVG